MLTPFRPESLAAFAHYRNIEDPRMLREAREALGRLLPVRIDTLRYGYRLIQDEVGQRSLDALILRELPSSCSAYHVVRKRWSKEHPLPGPNATREQLLAYYRELFAALGQWQQEWSGVPDVIHER